MTDTDARLERMEMELRMLRVSSRRWRLVTAGLIAVIGVLAIGGAGAPEKVVDELRVRSLSIVDENGKTRIGMTMLKDNPAIALMDQAGEIRGCFSLRDGGSPDISLAGKDGKACTKWSVSNDGGPALLFTDLKNKSKLMLGDASGSPGILMVDGGSELRASLSLTEAGEPSIVFYNDKGGPTWGAPK